MKLFLTAFAVAGVGAQSFAIAYGFAAPLINGAQELPTPTNSKATGSGSFTIDNVTWMLTGSVTIQGLSSTQIVGNHIHLVKNPNGTGPVVFDNAMNLVGGPINIPGGVGYIFQGMLMDDGNYTKQQKLQLLIDGKGYFNFHTAAFPGGEIRGNIDCVAVPEPATMAVIGLGLAALARRKRS